MSETTINTFITLLVIINPFAVTSVLIDSTLGLDKSIRNRLANKAAAIAAVLLTLFALIGDMILDFLGISEPAFRITGGVILALAGLDMVMAKPSSIQSPTEEESKPSSNVMELAVFPLAIPLMSGPGSLTSIVIMMRQAQERGYSEQIHIIIAMLIVVGITLLVMRSSEFVMKVLRKTGISVLTRVFGIILTALAIQNIIDGVYQLISKAS
ncbi:MarC family protein [Candidatus Odyssella thessalonicensis]|uniref:MarC family protein n=1 Tax=Candidatus Odyssella thessalonicensis TaxID=84647 RepID=UPI000225C168|nr:MarC family protein [Candidatus Odyssella thessalonicensis]